MGLCRQAVVTPHKEGDIPHREHIKVVHPRQEHTLGLVSHKEVILGQGNLPQLVPSQGPLQQVNTKEGAPHPKGLTHHPKGLIHHKEEHHPLLDRFQSTRGTCPMMMSWTTQMLRNRNPQRHLWKKWTK